MLQPTEETRGRAELHDFLGLTPEIRRLGIGEVPRPQGKAVRVVDSRAGRGGERREDPTAGVCILVVRGYDEGHRRIDPHQKGRPDQWRRPRKQSMKQS